MKLHKIKNKYIFFFKRRNNENDKDKQLIYICVYKLEKERGAGQ
jgi:hypothetical protein